MTDATPRRHSNPIWILIAVAVVAIASTFVGLRAFKKSLRESSRTMTMISLFEPHAGGCVWIVVELPSLMRRTLGTYRTDCGGARVVWSPSTPRALVWFGEDQDSTMLWLTDTEGGGHDSASMELPLPPLGDLVTLAFNRDGRPVAFTMDTEAQIQRTGGTDWFVVGDQKITALREGDGSDVLVHAMVHQDNTWKLTESRASKCCTDEAPGVTVLGTWQAIVGQGAEIGPTTNSDSKLATNHLASQDILSPHQTWAKLAEENLLARLTSERPKEAAEDPEKWGGSWGIIATETDASSKPSMINLAFWALRDEFGFISGHVRAIDRMRNAPVPLDKWWFSLGDLLQIQFSRRWILVSDAWSGTRPLVYDLSGGHLVYSSEVGHAAVFWP